MAETAPEHEQKQQQQQEAPKGPANPIPVNNSSNPVARHRRSKIVYPFDAKKILGLYTADSLSSHKEKDANADDTSKRNPYTAIVQKKFFPQDRAKAPPRVNKPVAKKTKEILLLPGPEKNPAANDSDDKDSDFMSAEDNEGNDAADNAQIDATSITGNFLNSDAVENFMQKHSITDKAWKVVLQTQLEKYITKIITHANVIKEKVSSDKKVRVETGHIDSVLQIQKLEKLERNHE